MARLTMKKYEASKADRAADRKGAKKAGVPFKKYEGSKADERADRRAVAKANKKGRK